MSSRETCISFMAGAITGAAITMLCAPMSGAEARRRIVDTGRQAGRKAQGAVTEVKDGVERKVSDAVAAVSEKADRVATAVERGKEAYRSSLASASTNG